MASEIQKISYPGIDNELYIMREDLIPFSFGGNKARIALSLLEDMKKKGGNVMIGTGTTSSNLCRALSSACAAEGIPCHIIVFDSPAGKFPETYNSRMVEAAGATVHRCPKDNVPAAAEALAEELRRAGLSPYWMNGEENLTAPLSAYAGVYRQVGNEYDYIFLPVGAAMTISGLVCGRAFYGGKAMVAGISISRPNARGHLKIREYLDAYSRENCIDRISNDLYDLTDEYLCGGYSLYNENVVRVINRVWKNYGIPLDPCYSGKGFYGMTEYLKSHGISGRKVLYIHTGGTPLFFDSISLLQPDSSE